MKNDGFQWTPATTKTFEKVKKLMTEALIMRLSDFSKMFEAVCDASGLAICGVLSQENHHVAYFSEKLKDARQRYSTYDKKFHTVVQVLCYWQYYLLLQEFVLHSNYEALKYFNSQKRLNARYSKWVKFL